MDPKRLELIKPALLGAVAGAAALAIIGFGWSNWHTGGSVRSLTEQKSREAVVAALAPICAEQFKKGSDVAAQYAALMKVSTWSRATFIEKGGWATLPGQKSPTSGVAAACADMLDKMKL
jgi:hypothetical protein